MAFGHRLFSRLRREPEAGPVRDRPPEVTPPQATPTPLPAPAPGPAPWAPPAAGNLADDFIRGLRAVLIGGLFDINGKRATVYVGRTVTAIRVPLVVRAAIRFLQRTEPTNRRLWALPQHDECAVFNILQARRWLIGAPGRAVILALVEAAYGHRQQPKRQSVIAILNSVLWAEASVPPPYEGTIRFFDLQDRQPIEVPGFVDSAPAQNVLLLAAPAAEPAPLDVHLPPRLLQDLRRAIQSKHLRHNAPGSQLYIFGDLSLLVIPVALRKLVARSPWEDYPEPVDRHLPAYLEALAGTEALLRGPGGKIVQRAQIEGCRSELTTVMLRTSSLLSEERRRELGDYPGHYRIHWDAAQLP